MKCSRHRPHRGLARGVDLTKDAVDQSIEVIDVGSGSAGDLSALSGFTSEQIPSRSIEQFILSTSGFSATMQPGGRSGTVCLDRRCSSSTEAHLMHRQSVSGPEPWIRVW